jgi:hypothetical protein
LNCSEIFFCLLLNREGLIPNMSSMMTEHVARRLLNLPSCRRQPRLCPADRRHSHVPSANDHLQADRKFPHPFLLNVAVALPIWRLRERYHDREKSPTKRQADIRISNRLADELASFIASTENGGAL